MDTNESTLGSFKVTDKRRFTTSGDVKQVAVQNMESKNLDTPTQSSTKQSQPPQPNIDFSTFVISMATQASMQMGLVEPPPGVPLTVDLTSAQQTIDILGMLEHKTRGNLNAEEERLLTGVLHELRLGFVHCSNRHKQPHA